MFRLKAIRPNKYRDNVRVERIDVSQLTHEQLEAIVAGSFSIGVGSRLLPVSSKSSVSAWTPLRSLQALAMRPAVDFCVDSGRSRAGGAIGVLRAGAKDD